MDDEREPGGAQAPDVSEDELGSQLDDFAPSAGDHPTRVVGIGGSVGSIQAMQRFFQALPPDSDMAFVVVLHLLPEHDSVLSEILQGSTSMPVKRATDREAVLPNHVYVIPPGKHLSMTDGHLRLTDLPRERGRRLTVDLFFRSLADTHGPHCVGIVLSGGDGDGALGIKRIKERGGLTIAQDPDEAENGDMPRSAIATGMVDWVLTADKIPVHLIGYQAREQRLQLPPETGPNPAALPPPTPSVEEAALRDVLVFLRTRTGRDFTYYKRATIVRRVARRMQVNEVDDLPGYLTFLRMHPGETGALLQDLLISVTNFFRDRDAFQALEAHIPELFRNKTAADTVRVWVPACATGEEAYSIAMLLSDHARVLDAPPAIQVFATDLDEDVLAEARNGLYPASISTDVPSERLSRFFVKEHKGYRVRRELREMLLFAVHDLLKDSPFSRLDLISCRNLLIYLNRAAQKRVFDIFHFALRPEGRLFLGTSESADDCPRLFHALDKRHRLYSSKTGAAASLPVPSGSSTSARALAVHELGDAAASLARRQPLLPSSFTSAPLKGHDTQRLSWSEAHLKLIERFGPPSLLVNGQQEVVHLSESAAEYLQFTGGEPSTNLFQLVHPAMRVELRAALFQARQMGQPISVVGVPTMHGGESRRVDIRVLPAPDIAPDLLLVTFVTQPSPEDQKERTAISVEPAAQHLERELEQTKHQLRDTLEQHEASIAELKASNEELQAMNEELRSTTEELETSREELQSINEELTTVNQELKSKVDELAHTNSDLHNLMGATAIAIVFLDRGLRIMRYTEPAMELFSFIPTDVGRPLAHLQHHLAYPELLADAARVVQQLVPIEREVPDSSGRVFLVRMLPYRTTEDRIAGAVLTFVEITERQLMAGAMRQAQAELQEGVLERASQLETNDALRLQVLEQQEAERARQELQRRLIYAQEEERRRLSRELHDEVGQQLVAMMLSLRSLEVENLPERAAAKVRGLRESTDLIGKEIHQLASQLRPIALDAVGLSQALSTYLDAWSERSGITVDFFSTGIDEPRLPSAIEITLYRIVQEATNNVVRHAAAHNVSVSIERRKDHVIGIIEDDGKGFDFELLRTRGFGRLGIAGMQERAATVDGELMIDSGAGGTTVRVKVPIPPE